MLGYQLVLFFYRIGIALASPFYTKAQKLWKGQKATQKRIQHPSSYPTDHHLIWVHAASLGEFEQARPIIEQLKSQKPTYHILLSFFSPSGYQIRKDYPLVDEVVYLPLDSKDNAKQFLDYYRPSIALVVKYEFWYYYFEACDQRQIPLLSISTILRPDQVFFQKQNQYTKVLGFVTHFFVQNQETKDLLINKGHTSVTVAGDTRFDRVIGLRTEQKNLGGLVDFIKDSPVVVIGSAWQKDIEMLQPTIAHHPEVKFIIAPHEIDDATLSNMQSLIDCPSIRYADLGQLSGQNVLFLNTMGMLSAVYSIAQVAYVGGAFGRGLHNVLEPATFGLPVVFGPKFDKFQEAKDLVNLGGAFTVQNQQQTTEVMTALLTDSNKRQKSAAMSHQYVTDNAGATSKVMQYLNMKLD